MMKLLSLVCLLAIIVGCGEPPPPKVEAVAPKSRPSEASGAMTVEKGF
jgi:hypothetical protein